MKWWTRIKELRRNRWLPFYLPIIGTLLYIALVLIAIPSELSDKDKEGTEVEAAPSASAGVAPRATAGRRSRGPNLGPKPPGSAAASKP